MAHTHYRTKAIFLKKEDRFEADQLLTVFTCDFGKLEVLARAIRKITSKLRSGAELFYFSEIEFIQGKNYKTLTDAILIDKFKNLRNDPVCLEVAYQVADGLDALCGKEEKDGRIWQLLFIVFRSLDICKLKIENSLKIENCKLKIIYNYFLWNLFALLGYEPELYHCAHCHKKLLPETLFFAPQEGGVVCWQCFGKLNKSVSVSAFAKNSAGKKTSVGKEISVETIKILRFFLQNSLEQSLKLKIGEPSLTKFEDISELYLNFLKEK